VVPAFALLRKGRHEVLKHRDVEGVLEYLLEFSLPPAFVWIDPLFARSTPFTKVWKTHRFEMV
jgi:hypothetical protein